MRVLEVRGLTKKYASRTVVNSVSFILKPFEVVGYLGPNGAGKTTTIKMLAGLIKPTKGEIYFDGNDIWKDINKYKKIVGYLPQDSELYHHLTAYEYLKLVGYIRGISENIAEEKIYGFMRLFNLENHMHSQMFSYSKGMKQKVLLSSALLHNPYILLFDEPLSGLDVYTFFTFRALLRRLSNEGKIIIYSSHLLEEIEKVSSRVIIIHNGSILTDDNVENLRNLTNAHSLEDVFQQIVINEDPDETAGRIIEIMKYDG